MTAEAVCMDPELFDSLVAGKIKRNTPEENMIWASKPLPINNLKLENTLTQESIDLDEPLSLQSHVAFKQLARDAYFMRKETGQEIEREDYNAFSFEPENDDCSIFQTDEDYQALQMDRNQLKQEDFMFYLQNEDDYPSLSSDYQDFEELRTSQEAFSEYLSTSDDIFKDLKLCMKRDSSCDSENLSINDVNPDATAICSPMRRQLDAHFLESALKSTPFQNDVFSKTFKLFMELSKNLDETRQVITSNNKDIINPHLNRFCFPILSYFKRRRCNTL